MVLTNGRYGHEFANKFENLKSELIETVTKIISTATIVHQTSADSLKFCLPFASQSKFAELFRTLEKEEGLQVTIELQVLFIIPKINFSSIWE